MKTIRRALLRTLPCMMLFHAAGWSQIVNGIQQGGLTNPNGYWNHHPFAMQDYSAGGVFRIYWSCGNPNGICVGHATSQTFFDFQPISINNSSPAVCDIQDPTVVKFNGMYYLYAAGIRANSPGCNNPAQNFHAAIYVFGSVNGVNFWPLNAGEPVIKVSADPSCFTCYTGKGISFPSAVVMGSGSFIRLYFHANAPGYTPVSDGILAMDTYDGVNFSNQRVIIDSTQLAGGAWAPHVRRAGASDFPLVMTYASGYGTMVATSSSFSDTSWTLGNGGMAVSFNPTAGYSATLVGDQTGLLLNTAGGAFTSPVSGQLAFWWANDFIAGSRIYMGTSNAAQYFSF